MDVKGTLETAVRTAIEQAMNAHRGCRVAAAKTLGISVRTLQRKLNAYSWQQRWPSRYAIGPKGAPPCDSSTTATHSEPH